MNEKAKTQDGTEIETSTGQGRRRNKVRLIPLEGVPFVWGQLTEFFPLWSHWFPSRFKRVERPTRSHGYPSVVSRRSTNLWKRLKGHRWTATNGEEEREWDTRWNGVSPSIRSGEKYGFDSESSRATSWDSGSNRRCRVRRLFRNYSDKSDRKVEWHLQSILLYNNIT